MANTALVQIRTAEEDKKQASEILERLGTNLSAVFNMLLKQIILTEGIPFEVSLHPVHGNAEQENIKSVAATMALEGMKLDEKDLDILRKYQENQVNSQAGDILRKQILEELGVQHE